ncbi:MAG: D-alanine--D-alanine ligase [Bacteroidota bacterium]
MSDTQQQARLKVGIFFGGPSREREIAFAGGRTVYDNLNKSLFEAIPIFVDSHRNFILLDWPFVYKGTIRDFYPPVSALPPSPHAFQVYLESLGPLQDEALDELISKVGRRLRLSELSDLIDMAFLALHGSYGEDGQIQGLLDSLQIPYTGSGIRACSIGIDKAYQKKLMEAGGFDCPEVMVIGREQWRQSAAEDFYARAYEQIQYPMVIRPACQGSSIGVSIIDAPEAGAGLEDFVAAIDQAFFRQQLKREDWQAWTAEERIDYVRQLSDIRDGLGFPVEVEGQTVYHPERLYELLTSLFDRVEQKTVLLESQLSEQQVIVEGFIRGKEFSCIVLRTEDGGAVALPPTEIVKGGEVFDYRSKYLPGLSRKLTPIDLPDPQINAIRQECVRLFDYLEFDTYARIDGFINDREQIFLNDPNTTSGMLPSSFFFHQAAEIGLNPSQFLTYIIRASLQERIAASNDRLPYEGRLAALDQAIASLQGGGQGKKKVGVFLGGYSFERHISVESGRNIFEKLASSDKYEPIPIFLIGDDRSHELYQIPINLLLKDNADDIRDKILHFHQHPVVEQIKVECREITEKYASQDVVFEPHYISYAQLAEMVDAVFIGLHGRPGEDGTVQRELARRGIAYNGSDYESSSITINKYETLQRLKKAGFTVADQRLISKAGFEVDAEGVLALIEAEFDYPLVAKPVDDGCSSAVKVIKERKQLRAFLEAIFRSEAEIDEDLLPILQLRPKEEFPRKQTVLIESLIRAKGARQFLEVTGGLMTRYVDGVLEYEVFEPSEALAGGEILSLEEKFLAGEGQNITPARFGRNAEEYAYIAAQVKADLERAARIVGVKGYARIDAFVRIYEDNRVETVVIEVNSLPGMTPATCIFHQTAINGYKPYDFIDNILEFGFHERSLQQHLEQD